MNREKYLPAVLALLVFLGCAVDEPVASPQAATSSQQSDAQPPDVESDVASGSSADEQPASEQDDDTPGLSVGSKAPEFELKDQNAQSQSLAGLLKSGSTALVFYRSADW
jgi:hypothetical protein